MKRVLIITLIAIPCLLALSYPWRNSHHGAGHVVSTIGWLGFLAALLTVLAVSVAMTIRRLRTKNA